ncbi:MAG TPA: hypothetical protein VF463_03330 [Sphingobium sp.]
MTNQEWVDPSTREQVTIMVVTTAVQFACGFGVIALVLAGLFDMIQGTLSARQIMAFGLCLFLTLLTGYRAMHLVVRPTWRGMVIVLLSGLFALSPIIALEF